MITTEAGLTLRERGKRERRRRIERAARAVFAERGYRGSTTREIAERAGVGNATLFLYARDKSQLLALVFREELAAITQKSLSDPPRGKTLLDQFEEFFRPRYELWARDPRLSRTAVSAAFGLHIESGSADPEDQPPTAYWDSVFGGITAIMKQFSSGKRVSVKAAARLVLAVYLFEKNEWLSAPSPDVEDGLQRLRRALASATRLLEKSTK